MAPRPSILPSSLVSDIELRREVYLILVKSVLWTKPDGMDQSLASKLKAAVAVRDAFRVSAAVHEQVCVIPCRSANPRGLRIAMKHLYFKRHDADGHHDQVATRFVHAKSCRVLSPLFLQLPPLKVVQYALWSNEHAFVGFQSRAAALNVSSVRPGSVDDAALLPLDFETQVNAQSLTLNESGVTHCWV